MLTWAGPDGTGDGGQDGRAGLSLAGRQRQASDFKLERKEKQGRDGVGETRRRPAVDPRNSGRSERGRERILGIGGRGRQRVPPPRPKVRYREVTARVRIRRRRAGYREYMHATSARHVLATGAVSYGHRTARSWRRRGRGTLSGMDQYPGPTRLQAPPWCVSPYRAVRRQTQMQACTGTSEQVTRHVLPRTWGRVAGSRGRDMMGRAEGGWLAGGLAWRFGWLATEQGDLRGSGRGCEGERARERETDRQRQGERVRERVSRVRERATRGHQCGRRG